MQDWGSEETLTLVRIDTNCLSLSINDLFNIIDCGAECELRLYQSNKKNFLQRGKQPILGLEVFPVFSMGG